jgi:hypothetical protein
MTPRLGGVGAVRLPRASLGVTKVTGGGVAVLSGMGDGDRISRAVVKEVADSASESESSATMIAVEF